MLLKLPKKGILDLSIHISWPESALDSNRKGSDDAKDTMNKPLFFTISLRNLEHCLESIAFLSINFKDLNLVNGKQTVTSIALFYSDNIHLMSQFYQKFKCSVILKSSQIDIDWESIKVGWL